MEENDIKTWGLRAEQREYEQLYYSGYCQKIREKGLEPMSYTTFKDELDKLLLLNLTKKVRMEKLLEVTK